MVSQHKMSATTSTLSSPEYLRGSVKWFNTRIGYGFITVIGGDYSGKDIFVHYLGIVAPDVQYKYLVQDEVVTFALTLSISNNHEFNATEVRGDGLPLMCETLKNQPPPLPKARAPSVSGPVSRVPHSAPPRRPRGPPLTAPSDASTGVDPFLLALNIELSRLKEYIRAVNANSYLPKLLAYKLIQSVFNNQAEILMAIEALEKGQGYTTVLSLESAAAASLIRV
jgi:cold shock CspA family protein